MFWPKSVLYALDPMTKYPMWLF